VWLRVFYIDTNLVLSANCEPATEISRYANAFGKMTQSRIDYRQGYQRDVVSERNPTKPWPSPGE